MSDDSGYQPQTINGPQILSADPNVAAAQGLGSYNAGAATSPVVAPFLQKLTQAYSSGQLTPGQPIGPGGADPKTGLAYSWLPYDPRQQIFDPHQHFGPTYNDPVLGQLQSLYTEPSKSANDFWHAGLGPTLFGLALSAITAGAGSPLLAGALKTAVGTGMSGGFNPLSAASNFLPAIPGFSDVAPFLGAASNAYAASKGNYIPGAISLGKIAGNTLGGG